MCRKWAYKAESVGDNVTDTECGMGQRASWRRQRHRCRICQRNVLSGPMGPKGLSLATTPPTYFVGVGGKPEAHELDPTSANQVTLCTQNTSTGLRDKR